MKLCFALQKEQSLSQKSKLGFLDYACNFSKRKSLWNSGKLLCSALFRAICGSIWKIDVWQLH